MLSRALYGFLLLVFFSFEVHSGGLVNCESTQSGEWRLPSTWSSCGGGIPDSASDNVIIKTSHEIVLDRTVTVYGLQMESNSTLNVEETNGTFRITAEGTDINSELGRIISGSSLVFTANNGDVVLGAIDNNLLNRRVTVQASQDVVIANSVDGFNVFYFVAESTNPTGKVIVEEDINTVFRQHYNSQLELNRSIVLTADQIQVSAGLVLDNHALELNINSINGSHIMGTITASAADLTKSGAGTLFIETPVPIGVTSYVTGGELVVNDMHQGDVVLSSAAKIKGNGAISSSLSLNDASTLSPGFESGGLQTAIFQLGDLVMSLDSTLKMLIFENVGVISQDLLIIQGNAHLDGILDMTVGYSYASGDVITIIDNLGNNPIIGTFDGINEGDIVADNFQISYQGGDGNDVTLTAVCGETETVTNNADQGVGSFRTAVENACESGTVEFADAYNIVLNSPVVVDNPNLIINGSGQTLESSGNHSILTVLDSSWLQINNITFQNTTSDTGALTNYGRVNLDNAYLKNNNNYSESGGGAISNYGSLTVFAVSFYQNNANQGGALHNDGGNVLVRSSTFYQNGNILTNEGGAIYNNYRLNLSSVSIIDSGNGSSVAGNSVFSTDSMRLSSTIISSSHPSLSECVGNIAEPPLLQKNFVNDGSCFAEFSGDPMIGKWGEYGAFAPTIPLLADSQLINMGSAINCNLIPIDQLGNPRFHGINCDIGAVEFIDDGVAPEISNVSAWNESFAQCDSLPFELSEINVVFNERVLSALETSNYHLLHSGPDQSFKTTDDYIIDVESVTSESAVTIGFNIISTAEIKLVLAETVDEGIVQLVLSRDIADEFYNRLNDGNDYKYTFRVDRGNAFNNGHFDQCVGHDPLTNWQTDGSSLGIATDVIDSNASRSIGGQVDISNPISIKQCVNTESDVLMSMKTQFKNQVAGSNGGDDSFNLDLYCVGFDTTDCLGDVVDQMSFISEGINTDSNWLSIQGEVNPINQSTKSLECGVEVSANQNDSSQVFLDVLELKLLSDLIYTDGFD